MRRGVERGSAIFGEREIEIEREKRGLVVELAKRVEGGWKMGGIDGGCRMQLNLRLRETRFLARRLVRWILACRYGGRSLYIFPFSGRRMKITK